ncbi:MAG TPA: hypothetical protein VGY98_18820 [Verrucomicrobiae bacterium]|nr:hypothetical protein [Verrucomicrobiae bacterium]
MKSPRKLLLARHRAIEPKLDDVRRIVVGKLSVKEDAEYTARTTRTVSSRPVSLLRDFPQAIWGELILPSRWIWAGLASVWVVLLAANFSMRDPVAANLAKSPPSPEVIMVFRQQQQLLSELIGPDNPPVEEVEKPYLPRPASERRMTLWTA